MPQVYINHYKNGNGGGEEVRTPPPPSPDITITPTPKSQKTVEKDWGYFRLSGSNTILSHRKMKSIELQDILEPTLWICFIFTILLNLGILGVLFVFSAAAKNTLSSHMLSAVSSPGCVPTTEYLHCLLRYLAKLIHGQDSWRPRPFTGLKRLLTRLGSHTCLPSVSCYSKIGI